MYETALAASELSEGTLFYSGYPRWRLKPPPHLEVISSSSRILVTYTCVKLPKQIRPPLHKLFIWQERGFDRSVSHKLRPADYIHGMPGQCLETFRKAREMGIRTVLNHATGPVNQLVKLVEPEFKRVNLKMQDNTFYNEAYFKREAEEYELADYHCVASTVVRDQLVAQGIHHSRIWVVPYGADEHVFTKNIESSPEQFRILFAGQLCLRKGPYYLLKALERAGHASWSLDCYGLELHETEQDFGSYKGPTPVNRHSPVNQSKLVEIFHNSSVLVLPSLEEGFGLVIVQALQCGLPCIVSDRVGAKDLIRHRENGSIVRAGDIDALATELHWWSKNPKRVRDSYNWKHTGQVLIGKSIQSMNS